MADESKPTETMPAAGESSGAGAESQPEVVETPEAKRIRELEEEKAKLEQRAKTQAEQLAAWQPKVEAFNVLQKATGQPGTDATASPTGAAGGGTLEQQLQLLYAEFDQFGLQTTRNQIMQLEAEMQRRQRAGEWHRIKAAAKLVFDALADREIATRAEAIFDTGQIGDPQVAIHAARGQIAEEKAAKPTPTKTTPTAEQAARPDTTFAATDGSFGGPKKMPYSEYDARRKPGVPGARKLVDDVEKGRIVLDYDR